VQKDVVFGLEQGSKALMELNKHMSMASVEKLMADTTDGIAYQNVCPEKNWTYSQEVSELLASKVTNEDEEGVLEELERMHLEALGLPTVPIDEPQRLLTEPPIKQTPIDTNLPAEPEPVGEREAVPA
jgi:charged multivesicular body protein 6